MEIREHFDIEIIRDLLEKGKPFNEMMRDIMKIGKEIVDRIGHKEYNNFDQFLADLNDGKTPLQHIDDVTSGDQLDLGTNVLAVKECAISKLMKEMSTSESAFDNRVDSIMDNFQTGDGIGNSFLDIGCYIMQQIRQMVLSSIKIDGTYAMSYIHLGCKKGDKMKLNEEEISAINIDRDKVVEVLQDHECIYAISFNESVDQ